MREILVDIDVFSEIWRRRIDGEASENDVLRRLLVGSGALSLVAAIEQGRPVKRCGLEEKSSIGLETTKLKLEDAEMGKVRWVDDVRAALMALGGKASLHQIYNVVRTRRHEGGRSLPRTFEAIIRRTLEDHSSDSANYKSDDLFTLLGRGEWGLR